MCMACNTGMSTKKKIGIFSAMLAGVAIAMYLAFTTNNPVLAVAAPLLLSLAPCLIMCGAIGGSMWLVPRLKNKSIKSIGYENNRPVSSSEKNKDSTNQFKN